MSFLRNINWSGTKHPRGSTASLGATSGGRHRASGGLKKCTFCPNTAKWETENSKGKKIPICGRCKHILS